MGRIFYLMGKSSSGKDTIYRRLMEKYPEFRRAVLYTTRPARENEVNGEDYYFTDESGLCKMQAEGKVLELRTYYTECGVWKYFTADDGQFDLEKYNYLMIGTLESCHAMKQRFGSENIVPLYIEVEDGLRLERALARERSQKEPRYAEMCRRFLADAEDFSEEKLRFGGITRRFDNTCLEECLRELEKYMIYFV